MVAQESCASASTALLPEWKPIESRARAPPAALDPLVATRLSSMASQASGLSHPVLAPSVPVSGHLGSVSCRWTVGSGYDVVRVTLSV